MPMLMGINRARYFMLTAQTITAQQALSIGMVNEVTTRENLMTRARELGREMSL